MMEAPKLPQQKVSSNWIAHCSMQECVRICINDTGVEVRGSNDELLCDVASLNVVIVDKRKAGVR